jgi:hypothetical protein
MPNLPSDSRPGGSKRTSGPRPSLAPGTGASVKHSGHFAPGAHPVVRAPKKPGRSPGWGTPPVNRRKGS